MSPDPPCLHLIHARQKSTPGKHRARLVFKSKDTHSYLLSILGRGIFFSPLPLFELEPAEVVFFQGRGRPKPSFYRMPFVRFHACPDAGTASSSLDGEVSLPAGWGEEGKRAGVASWVAGKGSGRWIRGHGGGGGLRLPEARPALWVRQAPEPAWRHCGSSNWADWQDPAIFCRKSSGRIRDGRNPKN